MGLNLENRIQKLETATRESKPTAFEVFCFKSLTHDELLAFRACYTEDYQPIPERVTPELKAALNRVRR